MAGTKDWFKNLDELLRGKKTEAPLLAHGTRHIPLGATATAAAGLGIIYGVFMGLFAVMTRTPPSYLQLLSTALKVPALFFLTLLITFPSLYVFSALLGTRLRLMDTLRLLVAAITINLCVLAAFAPITGFFTICTTSYSFMKLLNVLFFAIAGFLGVGFLFRVLRMVEGPPVGATLRPMPAAEAPPELEAELVDEEPEKATPITPRSLTPAARGVRPQHVLSIWLLLYALVGAQMGWILRPFIGSPTLTFEWFRTREANIFVDILRSIADFLGVPLR